ncbi:metalloregulator ArsR/SmtB family transcription factor [Leifsonia poae]|uniref:Transcriptional regulator n=1 Tax=Leifsonia poae TaxID=110933 RepID=A0A9W6HBH1_9MICO|nr:transcriptional regulator [Leifsonia poae]
MRVATDAVWDALADPTRRRIVELLVREPLRAGTIADEFPVAAPTISRHLRVLRTAGIIEETRVADDARVKVYRLRPEPFGDLGAWIDQVQAFWRDRLSAFAAAVDDEMARPGAAGAHPTE